MGDRGVCIGIWYGFGWGLVRVWFGFERVIFGLLGVFWRVGRVLYPVPLLYTCRMAIFQLCEVSILTPVL